MSDPLEAELTKQDPAARRRALFEAFSRRRHDLLPALEAFARTEKDEELAVLAVQVCLSLRHFPPDPTLEKEIRDLLKPPADVGLLTPRMWEYLAQAAPRELMQAALRQCRRGLPPEGVRFLEKALEHPDPEVRQAACRPGAAVGEPAALAHVLSRVLDPDARVAREAFAAVQKLPRAELARVCEQAVRGKDPWVAGTVARFFSVLACEELRPALQVARDHPDVEVSGPARAALDRLDKAQERRRLMALPVKSPPAGEKRPAEGGRGVVPISRQPPIMPKIVPVPAGGIPGKPAGPSAGALPGSSGVTPGATKGPPVGEPVPPTVASPADFGGLPSVVGGSASTPPAAKKERVISVRDRVKTAPPGEAPAAPAAPGSLGEQLVAAAGRGSSVAGAAGAGDGHGIVPAGGKGTGVEFTSSVASDAQTLLAGEISFTVEEAPREPVGASATPPGVGGMAGASPGGASMPHRQPVPGSDQAGGRERPGGPASPAAVAAVSAGTSPGSPSAPAGQRIGASSAAPATPTASPAPAAPSAKLASPFGASKGAAGSPPSGVSAAAPSLSPAAPPASPATQGPAAAFPPSPSASVAAAAPPRGAPSAVPSPSAAATVPGAVAAADISSPAPGVAAPSGPTTPAVPVASVAPAVPAASAAPPASSNPASAPAAAHLSFEPPPMAEAILARYPSFLTVPFAALLEPNTTAGHLATLRAFMEGLLGFLNFTFLQTYLFYGTRSPKGDQVVMECLKGHLVAPTAVRSLHHLALLVKNVPGTDGFFTFALSRSLTESGENNPLMVVKELWEYLQSPVEPLEETLPTAVAALPGILVACKGMLHNPLVMKSAPGAREAFFDLSGPRPGPLKPADRPSLDLPPGEIILLSRDRGEALGLFPYFTFNGERITFAIPDAKQVAILYERLELKDA